jgi:hypothetical protein
MVFPEKDVMLISPVHAAARGPVLLFKRKLRARKYPKLRLNSSLLLSHLDCVFVAIAKLAPWIWLTTTSASNGVDTMS